CLPSFSTERRLLVSSLLQEALPAETLVVAIDPGKVANWVWLASGEQGGIGEPLSLSTLRDGVDELERLIARSGLTRAPVIALEATGSLHLPLRRNHPGLHARTRARARETPGARRVGQQEFALCPSIHAVRQCSMAESSAAPSP